MKAINYIYLLLVFIAFSCKKNDRMTVVKDCTGTYLSVLDKDYQVCNTDKLAGYKDGDTVIVNYKKILNCKELENKIVCKMYHENEGFIFIERIK